MESSIILSGYWSFYLTYFIAIYPPLSLLTLQHSILYEILPVILHILSIFFVNYLWILITIYTHHRMQFIVDCRRCGVWIKISSNGSTSSSSSTTTSSTSSTSDNPTIPSSKIQPWKSSHLYRFHDYCIDEKNTYQLVTPFSSYSFPPSVTTLLPYKQKIYTIMNKESGLLSSSYILSCLLQCLSIVSCIVIVLGLIYPRQVSLSFHLFYYFSFLSNHYHCNNYYF